MTMQPFSFFPWIDSNQKDAKGLFNRWLKFARILSGDSVLAADLVQDCIERMGRKPIKVEPRNLYGYGTKVIINLVRNRYKRLKLSFQNEAAIRGSLHGVSRVGGTDEWAMLGGLVHYIERSAPAVPFLDVFLDHFVGMSNQELARKYNCSQAAVRQRICRARQALRALLRGIE